MKYRNASEILPDRLLREIQKYTSGEAIYIPQVTERQKWGEGSGARRYYEERNQKICEKHEAGASMEELADTFNLSIETIRKILYRR
ncbi:CD3324 family protein [uncultured Clostridium sp.]|uniref:CD3324 family protein n=1 Tax=uncultured Clostridium sp. TaxID=59620 RepID=UPI003216887E